MVKYKYLFNKILICLIAILFVSNEELFSQDEWIIRCYKKEKKDYCTNLSELDCMGKNSDQENELRERVHLNGAKSKIGSVCLIRKGNEEFTDKILMMPTGFLIFMYQAEDSLIHWIAVKAHSAAWLKLIKSIVPEDAKNPIFSLSKRKELTQQEKQALSRLMDEVKGVYCKVDKDLITELIKNLKLEIPYEELERLASEKKQRRIADEERKRKAYEKKQRELKEAAKKAKAAEKARLEAEAKRRAAAEARRKAELAAQEERRRAASQIEPKYLYQINNKGEITLIDAATNEEILGLKAVLNNDKIAVEDIATGETFELTIVDNDEHSRAVEDESSEGAYIPFTVSNHDESGDISNEVPYEFDDSSEGNITTNIEGEELNLGPIEPTETKLPNEVKPTYNSDDESKDKEVDKKDIIGINAEKMNKNTRIEGLYTCPATLSYKNEPFRGLDKLKIINTYIIDGQGESNLSNWYLYTGNECNKCSGFASSLMTEIYSPFSNLSVKILNTSNTEKLNSLQSSKQKENLLENLKLAFELAALNRILNNEILHLGEGGLIYKNQNGEITISNRVTTMTYRGGDIPLDEYNEWQGYFDRKKRKATTITAQTVKDIFIEAAKGKDNWFKEYRQNPLAFIAKYCEASSTIK